MAESLLSPAFLGLAVVASLALAAFTGRARQVVFLAFNGAFLWVLLPARAFVATLLFGLVGYVATRQVSQANRWIFRAALVLILLLFVYMRNYGILSWVLPERLLARALVTIGLSFMLFKTIHVLIDRRSGTLPQPDVLTYLNYCFNFTTFTMGPIQRFGDYRDQWNGASLAIPLTVEAHLDALIRILVGFVKACILAVWVEQFVLPFDIDVMNVSTGRLLVGMYAFYFYLYLSFAGYCDVMIGLGSLMGIRPPENFNRPFLATNISDFWLRQHRSLTLWLTDYVFSPLYKHMLGRRWFAAHPLLAANLALVVTMLVSGVWHGTTLAFVAFGILHGMFFVIFRCWDAWLLASFGRKRVTAWRATGPARAAGMAITFHAVAMAFVLFHHDIFRALDIYARLLRF